MRLGDKSGGGASAIEVRFPALLCPSFIVVGQFFCGPFVECRRRP